MMIKIILDTDIADDIDDAFCLNYLLNDKEHFDLLGVTTVFKNVRERALVSKKIIRLHNRNVPVYMGFNDPFKQKYSYFAYEKNNHLLHYKEDLEQENPLEEKDAVSFILETIKKHPNEICLMGIGPSTNLAKAYLQDPKTFSLVKEIYMMVGSNDFEGGRKEWNVMCDPEACQILFTSNLPITFVPYQITCATEFTQEEMDKVRTADYPAAKYINEMMEEWFKANKRMPVVHDVTAAYCLFNADYCFEFANVDIEIPLDEDNRGVMRLKPNKGSNKKVSVKFNREIFMNNFLSNYLKGEKL